MAEAPSSPRSGAAAGRVLALVPAHNEEPRIAAVVHGTTVHLRTLVVDDGSADLTAATAAAAGAKVLTQRNAGKGAALRAGFRHALATGYDAVITLDGDGQHDPASIPDFLAAWTAPDDGRPDLVIGARDFSKMPVARRIANSLGGRLFSRAVGRPIPDNQSGYRLVSRRLMEAMLASSEKAFEFEVEMLAVAIGRGWPVAWVPIATIYGAPSHIRPWSHFRNFLRVSRAAKRIIRAGGVLPNATEG